MLYIKVEINDRLNLAGAPVEPVRGHRQGVGDEDPPERAFITHTI